MDTGLRLAAVLALVAANGFFVAAEFALVTARKTRIEQLAAQGSRAAARVRRAIDDPNRFISACQLGITMASLALGWVGEETIAALVEPTLALVIPHDAANISSHAVAVPVAFALITFMHITLGEQAPKMLALQKGEQTAMWTVGPTQLVGTIFRPFIALLYGFTDLLLRPFGLQWQAEMHQSYTAEDLKLMIRSNHALGTAIGDSERIVERALDFATLTAKQVMVPRTEMVAVPTNVSLERLAVTMERHGLSRYPVYEGTPDNVIGVLLAKRLVPALASAGAARGIETFDVRNFVTVPLFAPENQRVDRLLADMKESRSHLAVLLDEYGVTAGLVTLRDLMDRIAGGVGDESDREIPLVERLPDGTSVINGLALLADIEEELGIKVGNAQYDTLGGFIFGQLGRRPAVGDRVTAAGREFVVTELDGVRVARVAVGEVANPATSPRLPEKETV